MMTLVIKAAIADAETTKALDRGTSVILTADPLNLSHPSRPRPVARPAGTRCNLDHRGRGIRMNVPQHFPTKGPNSAYPCLAPPRVDPATRSLDCYAHRRSVP